MVHLYIELDGDILTLDDAHEIDAAVDAVREARIGQARVWRGGPTVDPEPANMLLTDAGLIRVSAECFRRTR